MSQRYHAFIDGAPREAEREVDPIVDPWDGEEVARVDRGTREDLEAAVSGAVAAYAETTRMPVHERAAKLARVADAIEARAEELAQAISRSMGKPLRFARGEVSRAVTTFTLAAEECKRFGGETLPLDITPKGEGYRCLVERFPNGPVAGIAPFNFPLNLVAHKVAPALAVGSSIVLKPPPQAPTLALELAAMIHEAGFPEGSCNVVHLDGELSEALATDPRIRHTSFTGSARVGWHLKSACRTQKVTLEMGGNAAAVVHEDADLDWALERTVLGSFAAAGQVCIKVQRLLVHAPIYEEFTEQFVAHAEGVAGPDPRDEASVFGPMIDREAAGRVMEWVREAVDHGATLRCGGRRDGNVVFPTVLTGVDRGQACRDQEIFGPVTVIEPYVTFEDALLAANDSVFGLQAGVFTRDLHRAYQAFEGLEVGGVIVNDYPTFRIDNFPYGGVKASGLGREGVRYAMEDMTERRVMVVRTREPTT